MGRHRVPVEILEAKGAYIKNPQRRPPPSPSSNQEIGDPPNWLTEQEVEVWHEFVSAIPIGVAKLPDKFALALFCQLYAKAQRGETNVNERGQIIKILGLFGATPSDRSRIAITPEQKENPFSKFKT